MPGLTNVYLIQSTSNPSRHYVGLTADVGRRLASHNNGESPQTSKYRPWRLVARIQFLDEHRAQAFEKYLKSGSGRQFLERHLLP